MFESSCSEKEMKNALRGISNFFFRVSILSCCGTPSWLVRNSASNESTPMAFLPQGSRSRCIYSLLWVPSCHCNLFIRSQKETDVRLLLMFLYASD